MADNKGGLKARIRRDLAYQCKQIKRHKMHYVLMAPYLILFTAFVVIPVVIAIIFSFTSFNILEPPEFVGLKNYFRLFINDEIFLTGIKNTMIFAVITGPGGYLLALLFAWLINDLPRGLRVVFTIVFYAPSISGGMTIVWTYLFAADAKGFLNSWMMQLGLINEPISWLTDERYMMGIMILIILWMSLGTTFLSFIAGLQGVDRQYYEAAAIDGCGYLRYVIRCIVPLAQPAMVSMGMLSMIGVWNDIVSSTIYLTSESNYNITRGLFVFTGQYSNDWTLTAAGLLVVAAPLILIYIFGQRYIVDGVMAGGLKG